MFLEEVFFQHPDGRNAEDMSDAIRTYDLWREHPRVLVSPPVLADNECGYLLSPPVPLVDSSCDKRP
jgi:hypothetical protein